MVYLLPGPEHGRPDLEEIERGEEAVRTEAMRRLRVVLEKLTGPAGGTARWIMDDDGRWGCLYRIADHYANAELMMENWKDAEGRWKAVQEAAQTLKGALEALGDMACAVRLDAGARSPGLWERVRGYLSPVPGSSFAPPVHDIEWFAKVAIEECRRMKTECNGARREDEAGDLAFLFHQLFDLMEVPARPLAHVQRIGAAVHAWAFPKEEDETLGNPRFGERAMKRVKAFRKGARTPP